MVTAKEKYWVGWRFPGLRKYWSEGKGRSGRALETDVVVGGWECWAWGRMVTEKHLPKCGSGCLPGGGDRKGTQLAGTFGARSLVGGVG